MLDVIPWQDFVPWAWRKAGDTVCRWGWPGWQTQSWAGDCSAHCHTQRMICVSKYLRRKGKTLQIYWLELACILFIPTFHPPAASWPGAIIHLTLKNASGAENSDNNLWSPHYKHLWPSSDVTLVTESPYWAHSSHRMIMFQDCGLGSGLSTLARWLWPLLATGGQLRGRPGQPDNRENQQWELSRRNLLVVVFNSYDV